MYTSYRNGNAEAVPNSRTFTNVLQAWCRQKNGAERALAILDWMKELHSSKTLSDVKPNMITYATVLVSILLGRTLNFKHVCYFLRLTCNIVICFCRVDWQESESGVLLNRL
jgi:hypothetical protein